MAHQRIERNQPSLEEVEQANRFLEARGVQYQSHIAHLNDRGKPFSTHISLNKLVEPAPIHKEHTTPYGEIEGFVTAARLSINDGPSLVIADSKNGYYIDAIKQLTDAEGNTLGDVLRFRPQSGNADEYLLENLPSGQHIFPGDIIVMFQAPIARPIKKIVRLDHHDPTNNIAEELSLADCIRPNGDNQFPFVIVEIPTDPGMTTRQAAV